MNDAAPPIVKYGQPVTGNNFLFRSVELTKVTNAVRNNNSFLLFGLRRIGKSSILMESKRKISLEPVGRPIIFIDAQGRDNTAELFTDILNELPANLQAEWTKLVAKTKLLPQKILNGLKTHLRKGKAAGVEIELREDIVTYWRVLSGAFLDVVLKIPETERPFLLIDELPYFLENILEANSKNPAVVAEVLETLRNWRDAGIGMGLSGSISIEDQILDLGLSTQLLNNLARIQLAPLSRTEAASMIKMLARGGEEKWTEVVQLWLLDALPDYFHAFIQLAFFHLTSHPNLDPETCQRVFDHDIWRDLSSIFFSQFDERLQKRFDKQQTIAAELLLDTLVRSKDGILTAFDARKLVDSAGCNYGLLIEKLIRQDFLRRNSRDGCILFSCSAVRVWRINRGA